MFEQKKIMQLKFNQLEKCLCKQGYGKKSAHMYFKVNGDMV